MSLVAEEKKSSPVQVRESLVEAKALIAILRGRRSDVEKAMAQREGDYSRASVGDGPVDYSEINKLQKMRWQILSENQKAFEALAVEADGYAGDIDRIYRDAMAVVAEFEVAECKRLMTDFLISESNANSRVGSDPSVIGMRIAADAVRQQIQPAKAMAQSARDAVENINAKRSELSRRWRTI